MADYDGLRRVPDDQTLALPRRVTRFGFSGGAYSITWDPTVQDYLTVEYQRTTEKWSITTKHSGESRTLFCGMADWVPEIVDDIAWFEFNLAARPSITYWGDRVIYRTDTAVD